MAKVKNVIVISQLPPPVHGSSIMTQNLVEQLEESGVAVTMVERKFSRSIAEVGRFSIRKVWQAIKLLIDVRGTVRNFPDAPIVFFVTNRSFSLIVDWILSEYLRLARAKIFGYVHTLGWSDGAQQRSLYSFVARRLLGSCETLVTLGDWMTADLSSLIAADQQVKVIANAVPDPGPLQPTTSDRPVVLFLGNFIEAKGVRDFISLARAFPNSSADFLAVGAPESRAQFAQLNANVPPNLTMLPGVYGDEKTAILRGCDVLVVPSRYKYEAQPLVIVEALSYGIPVVAYSVGGIPDLLSGGGGIVVEAGAVDGLTSAVTEILSSGSGTAAMRDSARRVFEERFTLDRFRSDWTRIL